MDPSLPGVMQDVVVTVRQFKVSSGACSRFKPLLWPLLGFWKMDPSLPGGDAGCGGDSSAVQDQLRDVQQVQATRIWPLLGFWKMDPSLPGGMPVTVRQFEISSRDVQATQSAFASILADVSVVAWGDGNFGGDSSAVQHEIFF